MQQFLDCFKRKGTVAKPSHHVIAFRSQTVNVYNHFHYISLAETDLELCFKGTREGLDIIKVHGLPPHATEKGLLTELQLRVKSAQSDLLCKFDVVQWDRSKGEVRLHMKDMKGFDGHRLNVI